MLAGTTLLLRLIPDLGESLVNQPFANSSASTADHAGLAAIWALLGYVALCALALAWYRWLAPRLSRGALAAHGLLLKYPAFVVLLHPTTALVRIELNEVTAAAPSFEVRRGPDGSGVLSGPQTLRRAAEDLPRSGCPRRCCPSRATA